MSCLTLYFDGINDECKKGVNKHLSLFWQAVRFGFALDGKRFQDASARVLCFINNHTYEKILLEGLALLVRNECGDLATAACIFERARRALEKYGVQKSFCSDDGVLHGFKLYVLALYAKSLCYYYGERDVFALRTFQRCLNVLENYDRRSVCGIVRIGDVRNKVDSLSFLLNEYRQARSLVRRGDFGPAVNLLNPVIAKLGTDYLDHEVMLLAAEAHLARGNVHRGCELALAAYKNTPGCLEAQFVYALTLFIKGDDASLHRFAMLSECFIGMNTSITCKFTLAKQKRMKYVLNDLRGCIRKFTVGDRQMVVEKTNSRFVHFGKLKVLDCIQFVA